MLNYLETMKAHINHEESMGFKTAIKAQVTPNSDTMREMALFYPDNGAHFKKEGAINNKK